VELWQKRRVTKVYWAWVEGVWPERLSSLAGVDLEGRPMQTCVKLVERQAGRTLLELSPATGRRHQLRLQCSREGSPILGDVRYGALPVPALGESIALHARLLVFVHPLSNEKLELEAPLPASWDLFKV